MFQRNPLSMRAPARWITWNTSFLINGKEGKIGCAAPAAYWMGRLEKQVFQVIQRSNPTYQNRDGGVYPHVRRPPHRGFP